MNTLTKIKIDRFFGKPVVIVMNIVTRMLGFLLRIDHSFQKPPRSVAISKFMGMGNIIQSTPLLQTLRKNFPEATITFITRKSNREIIELIPFIDKALFIDDRNLLTLLFSSHKMIFTLWRKKNELYIDLETHSNYSTILSTLSVATNRIGFYSKESNIRMGLFTHMMFFNNNVSLSKVYLQLALLTNCTEMIDELYHFPIDEEIKNKTLEKIFHTSKIKKGKKIIIINPNSSDFRTERRWNNENFVQLINCIIRDLKQCVIVLIGNVSEKDYVKGIYDKIEGASELNLIDTSGTLTLTELISLIDASDIFITNDTGPMHISFSLKKQTIALFGTCSPEKYGFSKNIFYLYKNLYCSPCGHEFIVPPCKGHNECMTRIAVDEVLNMVKLLINNAPIPYEKSEQKMIHSSGKSPLGIIRR